MLKADKERIVDELTERLKTTPTLFVADYRGLSVTEIDELRTKVIEHGARFTVVKNTLTKRAAEAAGADALLAMLEGPTAIAFIEADGDMVGVAKALSDAAKTTRILVDPRRHPRRQPDRRGRRPEPRDAAAGRGAARPGARRHHCAVDDSRRSDQRAVRDLIGLIDARIEQLQAEGDIGDAPAGETPAEPALRNRAS